MMANLNLALILGHPLFYRKYRVIFVRFVLNLEKRIFLSPIQFSIVQETISGRMDPLMVGKTIVLYDFPGIKVKIVSIDIARYLVFDISRRSDKIRG